MFSEMGACKNQTNHQIILLFIYPISSIFKDNSYFSNFVTMGKNYIFNSFNTHIKILC